MRLRELERKEITRMDVAAAMNEVLQSDAPEEAKQVARQLVSVDCTKHSPNKVLPVPQEFAAEYADTTTEGMRAASQMHVTICGMARNIAGILPVTFARLNEIGRHFESYNIVVIENDSEDGTQDVLKKLEAEDRLHVEAVCNTMGWPHLHGFERDRVERYAILRNMYRDRVAKDYRHTDVVLVVDFDCWGGWSVQGLLNGIGWLKRYKHAACMASTSLFQGLEVDGTKTFAHYDTWALRVHSWKEQIVPWKTAWLPPPGAPPIKVFSAFGAAALYRPEAFFECEYRSIDGDIEHAGLHQQMIERGWSIYLNPAQRSLMMWEHDDAPRQHSDD